MSAELAWWPTTWDRLAPGDEIQAPDGSVWTVHSGIEYDGSYDFCITHPSICPKGLWSDGHKAGDPVTARRPPADESTVDEEAILGLLRMTFGNVTPLRS